MVNFMWDNLFRKGDQAQEVAEALRQTFVFQPLTKKELGFVQDTVHVRSFKPGEAIFRQGEIGVGMYIILRGALEIYVDHAAEDDIPARAHMVTRLRSGDFLGELSLVENNSRRTATAIAAEESLLIGFFKPDLFEILERQPTQIDAEADPFEERRGLGHQADDVSTPEHQGECHRRHCDAGCI